MKKLATYALIALLIWWAAKTRPPRRTSSAPSAGLSHAAGSLSTITSGR